MAERAPRCIRPAVSLQDAARVAYVGAGDRESPAHIRRAGADMNLAHIENIVNAVLYEGYMLYPYRPSAVKNRQRWTFGGIYPQAYSRAQGGSETWSMQAEFIVLSEPT